MITFWETNYRADRMSLSLVAPQSLNELERLARASFSHLLPPTRAGVGTPTPADAEYRDAPLPFGPMRPARMLAVRPANDTGSRGRFGSWQYQEMQEATCEPLGVLMGGALLDAEGKVPRRDGLHVISKRPPYDPRTTSA